MKTIVYPVPRNPQRNPQEREKRLRRRKERMHSIKFMASPSFSVTCEIEMGLAPGGRMKQEIYDDPYGFSVWDLDNYSRCFVHITNSITWRAITSKASPTMPPTAKQYTDAGLPWFDYYATEAEAVAGSDKLKSMKSVGGMSTEKGEKVLPENESTTVPAYQRLKLGNPDLCFLNGYGFC